TSPTGPYGRVVAGPPSSGTACAQVRRRLACPWVLVASTRPSGVQPRTCVLWLPQYVRRRAGPPSTGATCTSGAPSRVEAQATQVPSGEMRGWATGTLSALTRQARPPPSCGASHTSSSAVKATNSPCGCGKRRYAADATGAGCVTRSPYARDGGPGQGFRSLALDGTARRVLLAPDGGGDGHGDGGTGAVPAGLPHGRGTGGVAVTESVDPEPLSAVDLRGDVPAHAGAVDGVGDPAGDGDVLAVVGLALAVDGGDGPLARGGRGAAAALVPEGRGAV